MRVGLYEHTNRTRYILTRLLGAQSSFVSWVCTYSRGAGVGSVKSVHTYAVDWLIMALIRVQPYSPPLVSAFLLSLAIALLTSQDSVGIRRVAANNITPAIFRLISGTKMGFLQKFGRSVRIYTSVHLGLHPPE